MLEASDYDNLTSVKGAYFFPILKYFYDKASLLQFKFPIEQRKI